MLVKPPYLPDELISLQDALDQIDEEKLGALVFSGKIRSFHYDTFGHLFPLMSMAWRGDHVRSVVGTGIIKSETAWKIGIPNDNCDFMVYLAKQDVRRFSMIANVDPADEGPLDNARTAEAQMSNDENDYLPEFIELMLAALDHFGITSSKYPKKEELVEWFSSQKLPNGENVSPRLADSLATFCRPLNAMKGGNKRL